MSPRLRTEYDAIEEAVNRITSLQGDAQSALNQLGSTIGDMMGGWEGLASQSFMNWWSDIASKRANEILQEFQSLEEKLRRIEQTVQELDQSAAALFRQE